jgi:hypothetical protein
MYIRISDQPIYRRIIDFYFFFIIIIYNDCGHFNVTLWARNTYYEHILHI